MTPIRDNHRYDRGWRRGVPDPAVVLSLDLTPSQSCSAHSLHGE
ncbi:MAG: hypothetical protein WCI26_02245 [Acidimicrobiales bacterium]